MPYIPPTDLGNIGTEHSVEENTTRGKYGRHHSVMEKREIDHGCETLI